MYRANLPDHCPSDDAFEIEADLFRACRESPPTDEDYRPHNESAVPQKMRSADPNNCAGWGLSVWIDVDEIRYARDKTMPWMKRLYIFQSSVNADEGKLSRPGENGHHTYWPYEHTDLKARAVMVMEPEGN